MGVGVGGRDQGEMNDDSSSIFWRLEFLHCSSRRAPCDLSKCPILTPSSPWSMALDTHGAGATSPGNFLPLPDLRRCLGVHGKMVAVVFIHS